MHPNRRACFQSWAEELKSRSDRVRNLIGGVHWLSDGHHKEELVREFLTRYLPNRFRISRGFICPAEGGEDVSHEIDILITDSEGELPWFHEGGLIIAPPAAAVAQIHVKTRFAVPELVDLLLSGSHNDTVFQGATSNRSLWFGGVFFDGAGTLTQERIQGVWTTAIKKLGQVGPNRLPDCITVLNGPAFLLERSAGNDAAIVRAYQCGDCSAAALLGHLYDSLNTSGKDSTRRGEWFQMLSQISGGMLHSQTIPFNSA